MPSRTRSIAAVLFSSVILAGAGDATASAHAHHVSRHHAPAAHTHKRHIRRHHARRHHRKASAPTASAARAGRAGRAGSTLGKGKATTAPPRNVATTVTSTVTTQAVTSTQQSTATPQSTETLPTTTTTTSTTSTTPAASTSTSTSGSSGSSTSNGLTCGGEVPAPLPGGNPWQCTFDDEFNASTGDATALNRSLWTPQTTAQSGFATGPSGAQVCYVDSPDTINVSNGALHLSVVQTAAPFDCGGMFNTEYEGGEVMSYRDFNQTYGRYEVRALLPQTDVAGLQETLWLWPKNYQTGTWPGSGEIDFSEFYSDYENLDIPFVHYDFDSTSVDSTTDTNIDTNYCKIDPTQYNDYSLVWEPGSISVQINGATCLVDNYQADGSDSNGPFDNPMFINLTQALGVFGNAFKPGTTPLPATLSVQYVRVWQ